MATIEVSKLENNSIQINIDNNEENNYIAKLENEQLAKDKLYLINAAMDGGDNYHYAAHDMAYRDLERKCKRLEADYIISNRELLVKQVEIQRLTTRIAELEAERRWIPVGEKPLEAGTFFVLLKNGEVTKDFTFIDGGRYYWWNHGANITHYMPLPEPPIVYGKVCEE